VKRACKTRVKIEIIIPGGVSNPAVHHAKNGDRGSQGSDKVRNRVSACVSYRTIFSLCPGTVCVELQGFLYAGIGRI